MPQAADVDEAPADEDGDAKVLAPRRPANLQMPEDRLRQHEDHEHEEEPQLPIHEGAERDSVPDQVDDHRHDRMAHDLWVLVIRDPFNGGRECPVRSDHEMLDVVVDAPLPLLRDARSPDEAVQEYRKQRRRIDAQALDDVGVPLEENVVAIVVAVAVRADGQQVVHHRLRGIEAPCLDGPEQRRDRLRPDLHVQHPQSALPAGRASHCPPQLLPVVRVDRLHDNRRALVDHAAENARN
mmetsp:Transcript_1966/g.5532  ORF Transcript_1966/g.5532 Transcript_1966/m.5532 type:complete len:239 (-) Transcript_1966:590-1306(-)